MPASLSTRPPADAGGTCVLALSQLRTDEADLIRIEGLAGLSAPRRSDFWRGFHGYDARELELAESRWGEGLLSDQSGVVVAPGTAKWKASAAASRPTTT